MWLWLLLSAALLAGLLYWLLVITEGVFLGRRLVVWLYDLTAHRYDGIKQFDPTLEHFFLALPILSRLDGPARPRVLDVAAGTGRLAAALGAAPDFAGTVFNLEASWRMLRGGVARRSDRPWALWLQAYAAWLPCADESFDLVTCLEALEFFPSADQALAEMCRVLRPGGLLVVTRRKGWEARTFLGRYISEPVLVARLRTLGLVQIETMPWQVDYDLVTAARPPADYPG